MLLLGLLLFLICRSKKSSWRERRARAQLETTAIPFTELETVHPTPSTEKCTGSGQPASQSSPIPSALVAPPSSAVSMPDVSGDHSDEATSIFPVATSNTVHSPGGPDVTSIYGIYSLLAALITRLPVAPLPGERPPQYAET